MTSVLSHEQIEDLSEIQAMAKQFDADIVIIGAIALLSFLTNLDRFTRDIDLVIALDLDRFPEFAAILISRGWTAQRRLEVKVAPLPVIALLKVSAYLDDRHRRAKDLEDLKILFDRYERYSDRIFCDEVFRADLEDIEYASVFLLGLDIRAIATTEDIDSLSKFFNQVEVREEDFRYTDGETSSEAHFQRKILAFRKGLNT